MQDYVILDRDAAWQLFGSTDVAGMYVNIAGRPHIVIGVVERPAGKLYEAGGLDGIRVYVSLETLTTYGKSNGINHFEIVMPNPVKQYALNYVRENLGARKRKWRCWKTAAVTRSASGFGCCWISVPAP